MQPNNILKLMLAVGALSVFGAMGTAHLLKPDWFIKRSGARRGGDMLTEWNRLQFQIVGAVIAAFAGYGLYTLLSSCFGAGLGAIAGYGLRSHT